MDRNTCIFCRISSMFDSEEFEDAEVYDRYVAFKGHLEVRK